MAWLRSCYALNCYNKVYPKTLTSDGRNFISFHSIPNKSPRREKWLEFCNLPLDTDLTTDRHKFKICSEHFKESDFNNQTKDNTVRLKRILHCNANPTIHTTTSEIPTTIHKKYGRKKKDDKNILKLPKLKLKKPRQNGKKISERKKNLQLQWAHKRLANELEVHKMLSKQMHADSENAYSSCTSSTMQNTNNLQYPRQYHAASELFAVHNFHNYIINDLNEFEKQFVTSH